MIKKYLLIPIIIFITICGGEDADVSENNETVQNTINSSIEEPIYDTVSSILVPKKSTLQKLTLCNIDS